MNILLAEDNLINQEVVLGLLGTLDCAVTVVENGKEAVDVARSGGFDLVLMDCQMPIMDGLAATRAIRQAHADDRRVPIVALTAVALEDVRKQCLAAGMDDFLGKPIDRDDLVSLLQRWCPGLNVAPSTEPAAPLEPVSSSLDLAPIEALRALDPGNERQLVQRTISKFMDYGETLMTRLADAINQGDVGEVSRITHSLKSSSANLGATDLAQQCADTEKHTADGAMPDDIDQRLIAMQGAYYEAREDLLALTGGERKQ